MDPRGICCDDIDWICLARNAFLWPYVAYTVSNEHGLLSYSAAYSEKPRRFGGTYCLFHPGRRVSQTMKHHKHMASVKFDKVRNCLAP
jgi:hypothetical protein